jgi:hypothetical protein
MQCYNLQAGHFPDLLDSRSSPPYDGGCEVNKSSIDSGGFMAKDSVRSDQSSTCTEPIESSSLPLEMPD